jgi:SagB-type dehydrogenase family enzyme
MSNVPGDGAAGTVDQVVRYHDGTKHHFDRFARSLGYLDWASQPNPFRSYQGAPEVALPRTLVPDGGRHPSFDELYGACARSPEPITLAAIGFFLRHALGLSAWKSVGRSRWSLRVNPSSGNLHPTEAYVIAADRVWHYAADRHALEQRCVFADPRDREGSDSPSSFWVALTSIHWRESWKYGERAFRYCQHDVGHAVAALRFAAALCGWHMTLLPRWSSSEIAAATGIDRDDDFIEVEREEPACILLVSSSALPAASSSDLTLLSAIRSGSWSGRASQLSEDHIEWKFIDDAAVVTRGPVVGVPEDGALDASGFPGTVLHDDRGLDGAALVLQRRSALGLDGTKSLDVVSFVRMLDRVMPRRCLPWDALPWTARVHLLVFVHRVVGLEPGVYIMARRPSAEPLLRAAINRAFEWTPSGAALPLWRLVAGDARHLARRVSCDQDIAGDGFFSIGMLAEFDEPLRQHGPAFYRHLFWESGVIGQVLYLEAEAAGARGTGIGCFYDDAVHDVLGIRDHSFQSLYHFTIGAPVEDRRLTTEPGYS